MKWLRSYYGCASGGTNLGVATVSVAMRRASFPPVQAASTHADRLFATLDQRLIGHGADRWIALVTAIVSDGRDWWIQVSSGDCMTQVVLRVSRWARTSHILAALQTYEPSGWSHPPVIDVMRVR